MFSAIITLGVGDWVSIITAVVTVLGLAISMFVFFFRAGSLKEKVLRNSDGIEKLDQKIDKSVERLDNKIDDSVERLDKKIDDNVERLEKKIDDSVEKIEKKFDQMNRRFTPIETLLAVIADRLGIKDSSNPKLGFLDQKSPLNITDKGRKVAGYIEAQEVIDENWDRILEQIKSDGLDKDSNAYDLQQTSFRIGGTYTSFLTDERTSLIKTYAVKNGYNLYDFDGIFGVLIRDKYFQENNIVI